MASGTPGTKGSTSRPEARRKGKPDPTGGSRRARVLQLLMMQGLLAALLLLFAFLSRGEARTLALVLWTLLVPLGFGYAYGSAYMRHEAARREGRWSEEWERRETTRGFSILGAVFGAWIVGILGILVLL